MFVCLNWSKCSEWLCSSIVVKTSKPTKHFSFRPFCHQKIYAEMQAGDCVCLVCESTDIKFKYLNFDLCRCRTKFKIVFECNKPDTYIYSNVVYTITHIAYYSQLVDNCGYNRIIDFANYYITMSMVCRIYLCSMYSVLCAHKRVNDFFFFRNHVFNIDCT